MNFFEHQDLARRNTRIMVALYVLAVLAVVGAVDIVLAFTWRWSTADAPVPAELYAWGALGTAGAILAASAYHVLRLREGGEAIARMVGAQRLRPGTVEPAERRLLNVVEEMAIAAGTRVPAVYVMPDEEGINAFAAGYDVSSAVIAVTRGALQALDRDELQGVIAHEYSHIVNGDMRLNIRMVGVLGGIVFIGAIGEFMLRAGRGRGRRNSGAAQLFGLGAALMVIGYVGLFFARLIKAAVSRQREFLADASSVQFTRNPAAIAGALDKIRAAPAGTLVDNRYAEDLSHMFFAQAVKVRLAGLFDTHPPLDERIRRVMPGFPAHQRRRSTSPAMQATGQRADDQAHAWGRSPAQSMALVGTLEAAGIDYAGQLIERIPAALRAPDNAQATVIALLLAPGEPVMQAQLAAMASKGAAALAQSALALEPQTRGLGARFRLPVIDLALPALKASADPGVFLSAVEAVVQADRRVSLHEFVVLTLLRTQLQPPSPPATAGRSVSQHREDIRLLLSLVAHAGPEQGAAGAFAAGARELGLGDMVPFARTQVSLAAAAGALDRLRALAPLAKGELVRALFASITSDGKVRLAEAELMRMVGAALDCPVPPLLPDLE